MTLTEDIRRTIAPEWEGFEKLLTDALASRSDLLNRINTYLLDASGKKLRPLLALVTAKACSGSINQKAVACAAVSELIHTATLLHDDVVDDSDQRRGRMTVRKLFSPGASLLMGDYWLTRAIHLLIAYGCPVEVLGIYSKSLEELAEGEIIQMELADSLRATEDDYIQVIRRKTASLFIASVKGPAIVAGASGEVVAAMGWGAASRYGTISSTIIPAPRPARTATATSWSARSPCRCSAPCATLLTRRSTSAAGWATSPATLRRKSRTGRWPQRSGPSSSPTAA